MALSVHVMEVLWVSEVMEQEAAFTPHWAQLEEYNMKSVQPACTSDHSKMF